MQPTHQSFSFKNEFNDIYHDVKNIDFEILYKLFLKSKYNYTILLSRENSNDYVKYLIFKEITLTTNE